MQYGTLAVGLDVGSTTVKVVIIDKDGNILFNKYQRHYSDIRKTIYDVMNEALALYKEEEATFTITGSGGMLVSEWLNLPFVQEVVASTHAVTKLIPDTDVAIELGGEDAKITFFSNPVEQRMNGTCAGGTGAFIDQMAILLKTDAQGLNDYATRHKIIYPIAARCGVFAKTDIQPLLNEGASKEDIAASVFQSVVNQTGADITEEDILSADLEKEAEVLEDILTTIQTNNGDIDIDEIIKKAEEEDAVIILAIIESFMKK